MDRKRPGDRRELESPDIEVEERDDLDRNAILARRNLFIAIALSGLTGVLGAGCGGPQACLSIAVSDSSVMSDADAGAGACFTDAGPPPVDSGPGADAQPCLTDAGSGTDGG